MEPATLVDWLFKLGPFGVTGLLAYIWKLERDERKALQVEKDGLQTKLLDVALSGSKAMAEQGEATRNELKAMRAEVEELREQLEEKK